MLKGRLDLFHYSTAIRQDYAIGVYTDKTTYTKQSSILDGSKGGW